MNSTDLIRALKNLKVQTGSLACLGCGWEHNCSTQGCRIIREAAAQLEATAVDAVEVVRCKDCVSHGNCLAEYTFRVAQIDSPYCCGGKRREK